MLRSVALLSCTTFVLAGLVDASAEASEVPPDSAPGLVVDAPDLAWSKLKPTRHPRLHGVDRVSAYDPETGKIVLYATPFDGQLSSTWVWNGSNWTELDIISPPKRSGAEMAYDPVNGNIVLFGGELGGDDWTSETWIFDDGEWRLVDTPTSPPPREMMAMAFDPILGRILMFGGYGSPTYRHDTWTFDGSTWARVRLDEKPAWRAGAKLAFDPIRQQLVLFGGLTYRAHNPPDEGCRRHGACHPYRTWAWDGSSWNLLYLRQSPIGRWRQAMTTVGDRIVMFGGDRAHLRKDTWVLGAETWHRLDIDSPSRRTRSAFAYDEQREEAILFAGYGRLGPIETVLSDTWRLAARTVSAERAP